MKGLTEALHAWVNRREPRSGTLRAMAQRNVRLPLPFEHKDAPDPIRYSDFWSHGKPWEHAKAHAQVHTSLNIAEIQSVQEDTFLFGKFPLTNMTKTSAGLQAPLVERANIFRPEAVAYGSQYTVNPPQR